MTTTDQVANLLGALALVLTDRTTTVVTQQSGISGTAAAALSALHQFLDRPTVDQLHGVLGLTPSGTVRLVDRLAAAGLVERGPGPDGRSRSLTLTPAGRAAAAQLSAARIRSLRGALAGLTEPEQETLHSLLSRLMSEVVAQKDGGAWICRLCDLGACGRAAGGCPTANAAATKYGLPPPGSHASGRIATQD